MTTKVELVAEIARLQLLLITTRRLLATTEAKLEAVASLADAERYRLVPLPPRRDSPVKQTT